ncbi:MAG: hypothetical protein ACRCV6_08640 [Formosimonas sp.]
MRHYGLCAAQQPINVKQYCLSTPNSTTAVQKCEETMFYKQVLCAVLLSLGGTLSACSSPVPSTPQPISGSVQTTLLVKVADWLKNASDPFNANIQLTYETGAYAGTMTFKPNAAPKKAFDVTFYNQFIACLANDLAKKHHAKSWFYYGLHAEENTDPSKERNFFIIFRNEQSIESIQKQYMLPVIDERGFYKTDDALFTGAYCANYKSNLTH